MPFPIKIVIRDTDVLIQSFLILLPLFILIFSGFLMGRLVKLSEDTLLRILADYFMPMLVFSSLYLSPVSPFEMLTLSGSVVFVIVLTLAAAGFIFNLFSISIPESLIKTFTFAGNAAPPLAAFALGHSLSGRKQERISIHVFIGIIMRIAGGFLCGILAIRLFNVTGLMKTVILVTSALPAAVFSYVLPARLGYDSSISREIVIISTILGVLTIPFSFYLTELI